MNTLLQSPIALMGLGTPEMLLIFAIVVLLFGAKKLPELAKGLGKSVREFKKASAEDDAEEQSSAPASKPAASKPETTRTHGSN